MLAAVKQQGLEDVIAKRKDSLYEAGKRSGAWVKHRVNSGQEFVVGGYARCAWDRRDHCRLLQGPRSDLCGENTKWICAGFAT